MIKEVLNLIVKNFINGGKIDYEIENGSEGKILVLDLIDSNNITTNTLRIYYINNNEIAGILID